MLSPIGSALQSPELRQQLGCGAGDVYALTSQRPDPAEGLTALLSLR